MNRKHLGDSYDIVKRFLLHAIAPRTVWAAFPMLTDNWKSADIVAYENFLHVKVAQPKVIDSSFNRAEYFSVSLRNQWIFIDPNIGVKVTLSDKIRSSEHVLSCELIWLCDGNDDRLVLAYDQSHPRGKEAASIKGKLDHFGRQGISSFAYLSHACFLVMSRNEANLRSARERILVTRLSQDRIVIPHAK